MANYVVIVEKITRPEETVPPTVLSRDRPTVCSTRSPAPHLPAALTSSL